MKFAKAFETLNGRPPETADIRRFQTLTNALETTPEDAILSIFVACDHYEMMYEKIPAQIIEALRVAVETANRAAKLVVDDASGKVQTIVAGSLVPLAKDAFEKGVNRYIDQIDGEARNYAKTKAIPVAIATVAMAVLVGIGLGWAGGTWARSDADATAIASAAVAQKTVAGQLAQKDAEAAATIANLKAEQAATIANLNAAKVWSGTAEGQLAYKFFTVGSGALAAKCQAEHWTLGKNGKGEKLCIPQHEKWSGWTEGSEGWVIP
ncbi:hypothetical protein [Polaromonas naphthalenivorans]|uniref:Uncharacterized protein n=1 Tax=Polaromonas naphthalenivorans (strain CJ2) TaxID=365044 RepID=A1VX56_POLNA|nr:hypothetical protein [Polaromonas naphthalenivorans]ABM40234.1 hypothetical protein Pnap_4986 [Polaromonas naphthalenivorans CJ2]